MKISLKTRMKKPDNKSSTQAKAKMETLFKRIYSDTDDIEDVIAIDHGKQGVEEIEAPDSVYERSLFRKGLGFEQVASRGYSISAKNIKAYYKLRMLERHLVEQDPDMKHPLTQRVHSRFVIASNNLLQRTITKEQTNVEVVDVEPMVKVITVPSWGRIADTDMEKEKKEDE